MDGTASSSRPTRDDAAEILLDFTSSEHVLSSGKARKGQHGKCCETLSKSFALWMVHVWRVGLALVLVSVFLYQPSVSGQLPRPLFFLVLLSTMLAVKPFLGMSLLQGTFQLPLFIVAQLIATGVAYLMPVHPAFVAFVIFIGVLFAHWLELPPGAPKIVSAIWLITMSNRCVVLFDLLKHLCFLLSFLS
jgi:hypothetical protein